MFQLKKLNLNLDKIRLNKNTILIAVAFLGVAFTAFLILDNNTMPANTLAQNAVDYLNKNFAQNGQNATLGDVSKENGLIKMGVKMGNNTYDMYITKDGKLLFPQAIAIDSEITEQTTNEDTAPATRKTADSLKKVDKPLLEAYVVSQCPFGLQAQRAMEDAVKNIPSLAQYFKVRFIGNIVNGKITAMHGEKEALENSKEMCIREEMPDKFWPYIACYIKAGDGNGCLSKVGIDQNKLNTCMTDSSKGLAYAKEDFDLTDKYGISGSPTFILNGEEISESDFGGRSSEGMKTMVCSSSSTQPGFCSTKLNTTPAATSFSPTYSKNNTTSSTKNNSLAANSQVPNCAATQ